MHHVPFSRIPVKNIFPFLLLLTALVGIIWPGIARAESFTIGTREINFSLPQGYVAGTGAEHEERLRRFTQSLPESFKVHALYYDTAGGTVTPEESDSCIALIFLDSAFDEDLRIAEFEIMRDSLEEGYRKILNDANKKPKDAAQENGAQPAATPLGIWATDTTLAVMVRATTPLHNSAAVQGKIPVVFFTYCLANGKFVMVNRYSAVKSEADMEAFKESSKALFEGMELPLGEARGPLARRGGKAETAGSQMTEADESGPWSGALTGGALVVLFLAGYSLYRQKKKK